MTILLLIKHTFRELISRVVILVLMGISTLVLLGVLGMASFASEAAGQLQTLDPLAVQQLLAGLVSGLFIGIMLLGTIASAPAVSGMLNRGTVEMYLAKPIPRWVILMGRFLGALAAVGLNILYFVLLLWIIAGLRFGTWSSELLLAIPLVVFVFACLWSIVLLQIVLFRNAPVALLTAFFYYYLINPVLDSRETMLFQIFKGPAFQTSVNILAHLQPQVSAMQTEVARLIQGHEISSAPFLVSGAFLALIFAASAIVFTRKDF